MLRRDGIKMGGTEKPVIPIVFSSNNDDYAMYCYVSIFSMLENANRNYFYKIVILQTETDEYYTKLFETLNRDYAEVSCVNISALSSKYYMKGELHVSTETYFRFFIPLVMKGCKKVVYLDSDIIVKGDISEFYNIDIGEYAVGAIPDTDCDFIEEHSDHIGLEDYKNAFNAGILLINIEEFERQKIRERCLALLEEDNRREKRKYYYLDNDALNIMLHKNYFMIDRRWNVQWQYTWRMDTLKEGFKENYYDLLDSSLILHYAGDRKPWEYPTYPYANIFWDYAKKTEVFAIILDNLMTRYRKATEYLLGFESYTFPYDCVPYKSKIVLYGAGVLGRLFYKQAKVSRYADVVLVVDKNWENCDPSMNVKPIETVKEAEFDYVLIANMKGKIAKEIKTTLLSMGVDESKILWSDAYDA